MGNSLRCCLACVLPCGALDLVRIVHLSGQVDVYSRPVLAGEILAANPNHVLTRPCSQVVARKTVVVSAESHLKRGNIYFLIPATTTGDREKESKRRERRRRARSPSSDGGVSADQTTTATSSSSSTRSESDYLTEILSEVKPTHCRRRSTGRIDVWRPHLQSIHEDP